MICYELFACNTHVMLFLSRSRQYHVLDNSKTFNPLMFWCMILAVRNLSINWHRSFCINIFTTVTTTMLYSNKHAQIGYCVSSHEIHRELNLF